MFTLEDMDLASDLEFFRVHGLDVLGVPEGEDSADRGTIPEADARLHPDDYFIAGV